MTIDTLKINKLSETQRRLYSFLDTKSNDISESDVQQWISECLVHFTEVGVPSNIISFFLEKIDHNDITNANLPDLSESRKLFIHTLYDEGYSINPKYRLSGQDDNHPVMNPFLVAFKVAENLIDSYEDTLHLVPQSLMRELDRYNETKTLSVSLSAIQSLYPERNTKGILVALVSATESLLKLIPELSDKNKLYPKIQKAYETKSIYEKYSMSREILWSLNNARIIRNTDIHEPDKTNETPMYEVVSYSHLLVLLILSILNSGEIALSEV